MELAAVSLLSSPRVALPQDVTANVQMVLRWVHFVAGITWLGLLYFFNLVNIPFMKEIEGATRSKVVTTLLPRALWWFRWAAVVTVLAGLCYWMMIVHTDAHNAQASGGRAIAENLQLERQLRVDDNTKNIQRVKIDTFSVACCQY